MDLAPYQERVPTLELQAGDFLYTLESTPGFQGIIVESRITEIGFGIGKRNPRFGVRTRVGGFSLDRGWEYRTTCIIKKREDLKN